VFPSTLVEAADGTLLGSTFGAGTLGLSGAIFKLNKDGSGYTVLNGTGRARLSKGTDGAVYGTAGEIFALRPQPTMLPPIHSGGGVQVRFTSMPGSTHQLQRASAIGGNWLSLTNLTVPTNGVAEFTDPAPPQPNSFYRTVAP
jgi:hypothetical protein